jgi:hypothetical protein
VRTILWRTTSSARVRHPVEIIDRIGVGLELDDRVETLVDMVDLVGEATLAPEIGSGDGGAPAAEEGLYLFHLGLDIALGQFRPVDGHDFITAHRCVTSCGHPSGRPHSAPDIRVA